MPKKSKKLNSRYKLQDLDKAVDLVKSGQMSTRLAAKKYGIPKSTISDRITGRVEPGATPGKNTVFERQVEDEVAEKIKLAAKKGFGINARQLRSKMAQLASRTKMKTPFKNGIPGKDWVEGFKKRHPDVSLRAQVPLTTRARMLNPLVTKRYFDDLGNIIQKLNLNKHPERIWNIDEKSVSLTHKPSKVLAEKGSRNVPGRVGNSRDTISVLAYINASGNTIPPMVIFKGKTKKVLDSYNTKEGVPGTKYTFQDKAWMEDVLGNLWFSNHFLQHCGPARPQLIVLDSHSSHETLGLIECARANNIELFTLPPHTTHWLNPLDKSVFGVFEKEYDSLCTEFMSKSPSNVVNKWEWPKLFYEAYNKSFSRENIVKGFRKCGIFPFNAHAVSAEATAPSEVYGSTSTEFSNCTELDNENTNLTEQEPPRNMPQDSGNSTADVESSDSQLLTHNGNMAYEVLGEADSNGSLLSEGTTASDVLNSIVMGTICIESATSFEIDSVNQITESTTVDVLNNSISPTRIISPEVINETSPFSVVNSLFNVPIESLQKEKKNNARKLTSHRLLTSDEIFEEKQKENNIKQEVLKEKERKKQEREIKRKEREENAKLRQELKRLREEQKKLQDKLNAKKLKSSK